ncbi:hypothetical protein F4679DRAFT_540913 [Xylaria curta]|nr:hypothetical protein F4679DRAFT_540913 [Xylaria curta]
MVHPVGQAGLLLMTLWPTVHPRSGFGKDFNYLSVSIIRQHSCVSGIGTDQTKTRVCQKARGGEMLVGGFEVGLAGHSMFGMEKRGSETPGLHIWDRRVAGLVIG